MPDRRQPKPDHICPCGCGARISYTKLACRDGWWSLPAELRQAVTKHKQGTFAHLLAVSAAVVWLKDRKESSC